MTDPTTAPTSERTRGRAAPIDPRLFRRASATKAYLFSGVVVGTLTAVLVVGQAELLSGSIAHVFDTHSLDGLGLVIAGLAAVVAGRGVLAWLSSWLAHRTSAAVKSQLRRDILSARLASPALQTSSSSSLVTLVTQGLDGLDGYFSKYLPQLLLAVTVPVLTLGVIAFADWQSALIIAATIPFIPVLMALVGRNTQKQISKRWAYQSRLASHFADLVAGLPTLQVFGRAKAQAKGLQKTEGANREATMRILRFSFLSALVLEIFSTIAVALIALTIGTRLLNSMMDFRLALLVLILAPEVYLPIRQVSTHFHDSANGLAAAQAAFAEIDRAGAPSEEAPGAAGDFLPATVEARGLTYTYPDGQTGLEGFDFDVAEGEIVALAGRSGGGKTTLLNCIMGFLTPAETPEGGLAGTPEGGSADTLDGGSDDTREDGSDARAARPQLVLGGIDARRINWARWRSGIAYVPQVPGLIDGTIGDNVRLGWPEAGDDEIRELLAAAGAPGLDPARSVGEEGEGLSVGERRRVGIARGLARIRLGGARLLILDEPTAGLDTDSEATVLASLREAGATAIVVSHREAVLSAADRVVRMGAQYDDAERARVSAAAVRAVGAGRAAGDGPTVGASGGGASPGDSAGGTMATESGDPVDGLVGGAPGSGPAGSAGSGVGSGGAADGIGSGDDDRARGRGDGAPAGDRRKAWPLMRLVISLLDSVPQARLRLLLSVLVAAAASGAAVALMGVSAWLISRAAEHPSFEALSVAAVGVRFFGISRGVFRYLERLVGHQLALSLQSGLRLKTYEALARTTLLGRRQGDLLVRVVSDVGAIEDIVVRIVQPVLAAGLVVLLVCAMLGRFSPGAALVILASALLGGLVVPWLTARLSRTADEESVPLRGKLGGVVHDLSRTAVDLAAYGAREPALARLARVDAALRETEARIAWAKGIGAGLQTVAAGIGFIGGLWIGAIAVADGSMAGRLLAVLVLTPLALHEVFATFAAAAQAWTRARVALGRVSAILDAPPIGQGDVEPRDAAEAPSLHCAGLAIGWPGCDPVATDLALEVGPGEAVCVMGPSGIGKTTLAATIMGLIPPVSGELVTTGRVGYLAQDAHIFSTSVAENVRIGNKDATDDEVVEALAEAGLDMALDREIREMGAGLSGGEARRLALARLFAGDYRLLILDEPTEHLDRETADALLDEIFAGLADRPVLVVTHDESVAARCDRVLVM